MRLGYSHAAPRFATGIAPLRLASRRALTYGTEVTPERLGLVERGASRLRALRIPPNSASDSTTSSQAWNGNSADEMPFARLAAEMAAAIADRLKAAGFKIR